MARALGDLVFIWIQPEYNQLSHVSYCRETHGSQSVWSVCIHWSDGRLDCLEACCLPPVTQRLRELHTQPLANQKNICAITDKPLMPFLLHSYWNITTETTIKTKQLGGSNRERLITFSFQVRGGHWRNDFWLFLLCEKSWNIFHTSLGFPYS